MGQHIRKCLLILCSLCLLASLSCASPLASKSPAPIEVTDQLGRVVKLDKIPERIISLAPSNTEVLFALGLGDKVVGVTDFCDYPPEAQTKPSIGGYSTPDMEKIIALAPDLLVADAIQHEKETIPELERRGLAVIALGPKTLDEVLASINIVGKATGKEKEASRLVKDLTARIKAVTGKTAGLSPAEKPKVLFVTWHDPLWTAGSGTLINELIEKAGGVNIAQGLSGYQVISLEEVVAADPDVIITLTGHGVGNLGFEWAQTEPRLKGTSALKNGRVYQIYADIAARSSPRIVIALEEFAEFFHPELFKKD
jgi:iron complex transport system substrate-binding protein